MTEDLERERRDAAERRERRRLEEAARVDRIIANRGDEVFRPVIAGFALETRAERAERRAKRAG